VSFNRWVRPPRQRVGSRPSRDPSLDVPTPAAHAADHTQPIIDDCLPRQRDAVEPGGVLREDLPPHWRRDSPMVARLAETAPGKCASGVGIVRRPDGQSPAEGITGTVGSDRRDHAGRLKRSGLHAHRRQQALHVAGARPRASQYGNQLDPLEECHAGVGDGRARRPG
jgi:hypothetical protein